MDFFYLTTETTPSMIEPSSKLLEDYSLNKRIKQHMSQSEDNLKELSHVLVDAEMFLREKNIKKCFDQYIIICKKYEALNDYETASYFYNHCLEVAIENNKLEEEIRAYKGLGICEEQVLNIFESMEYLEKALEKAIDNTLLKIEKEISLDLVRVYKIIAIQFQD